MQAILRNIFTLTVLAFWVLFGIGLANGSWTAQQWIVLGIGHAICLVIFYRFVHVFTYGYSVTLVTGALAVLAMAPGPAAVVVVVPAILFGLRLTWFIWNRNRSASYAASLQRQVEADAKVVLPFRIFMWLSVSWLMGFELMPLLFRAQDGAITPAVVAGAAVMLAGLVIEGLADAQKQAAKQKDPATFARHGLYRVSRHPNYLGEIVFQVGVLVACLGAASGAWQVLVVLLAPLYIITLMTFAGLEADHEQLKRYGADPAYVDYRARTGCFLPGL